MLAPLLSLALAQDPTLDLQRFVPQGHAQGFVSVPSTRMLPVRGWDVQLLGSYGGGGLLRARADGDTLLVDDSVRSLAAMHVRGAYGLVGGIELALQAPLLQGATLADGSGGGRGDVRLAASFRPLDPEILGVVLTPFVRFPTGSASLTRSVVSPGASLALGKSLGAVHLTGSLGGRFLPLSGYRSPEVGVAHELTWGLGVGLEPAEGSHVGLELLGASAPTRRTTALEGYRSTLHRPVELLLGGRTTVADRIGLVGGTTLALVKGVATPSWRVFLGASVHGEVRQPEELPAPLEVPAPPAAVHTGLPDRDRDGVHDEEDACPLEPEDLDGFLDGDGCPDPDNDRDGVPDEVDLCPLDAEIHDGVRDGDGCPDELGAVYRDDRIHVLQQVHFSSGSARLEPASEPVLRDILQSFVDHPEIARVRIEGHTDGIGDPQVNLRLSGERAAAVRDWLLAHGVTATLESEGFGPYSPIAPNTDEAGRERNRRVELWVLETRGVPTDE